MKNGKNKTVNDLLEFLNNLVVEGKATFGSVRLLITATKTVLKTTEDIESWADVPIASINPESRMEKFKKLTPGSYQEASYATYKIRLIKALDWYDNYLSDPSWIPSKTKSAKETKHHPTQKDQVKSVSGSIRSPKMITYPFPIENGEIAQLTLPTGITQLDVARLSNFLNALVLSDKEEGM